MLAYKDLQIGVEYRNDDEVVVLLDIRSYVDSVGVIQAIYDELSKYPSDDTSYVLIHLECPLKEFNERVDELEYSDRLMIIDVRDLLDLERHNDITHAWSSKVQHILDYVNAKPKGITYTVRYLPCNPKINIYASTWYVNKHFDDSGDFIDALKQYGYIHHHQINQIQDGDLILVSIVVEGKPHDQELVINARRLLNDPMYLKELPDVVQQLTLNAMEDSHV